MKKFMLITLVICFLFTGCGNVNEVTEVTETISTTAAMEQTTSACGATDQ